MEEDLLDLVVVDAEMIKTIVRTQGQILSYLENIYGAMLVLSEVNNDFNKHFGELVDGNKQLAINLREFNKWLKSKARNGARDGRRQISQRK